MFKQKSKELSLLNVVQKIQFTYRKKCLLQRLMTNNDGIEQRLIRYVLFRGFVLWMYYLWDRGTGRMTLEVAVIDPAMAMRNTKVLRLHISHAYFHQTATFPVLARLVQVQGENILITSLQSLRKQLDKVTKVWLAKSLHKLMQVFFYKNSKVFLLKQDRFMGSYKTRLKRNFLDQLKRHQQAVLQVGEGHAVLGAFLQKHTHYSQVKGYNRIVHRANKRLVLWHCFSLIGEYIEKLNFFKFFFILNQGEVFEEIKLFSKETECQGRQHIVDIVYKKIFNQIVIKSDQKQVVSRVMQQRDDSDLFKVVEKIKA